VEATYIKDPITKGVYNILITAQGVTKGGALRKVRSFFLKKAPFIAAGDDLNDVSMLQEADIAIAMETAPDEVLALGDILAESAAKMGIIPALEKAMNSIG
jgi:hydroxymethylpyrimidine pyrophosphatase-like HAD family hydrolase